jgi:hypothetical protein
MHLEPVTIHDLPQIQRVSRERFHFSLHVTMFQRSSTYVLSTKKGVRMLLAGEVICYCRHFCT